MSKKSPALLPSVAERNAAFQQMTLTEKRLTVVREALRLLDDRVIATGHSGYFSLVIVATENSALPENAYGRELSTLLETNFEGTKKHPFQESAPNCTVCALGALFAATVFHTDNFLVESDYYGGCDVRALLEDRESLWSNEQLRDVENAYELSADLSADSGWRYAFGNRFEQSNARLRAILGNMLEHDGVFTNPNAVTAPA